MAGSIELFQFLQKYSRWVGFDQSQESNGARSAINWKKWMFFVAEAQFIVGEIEFMSTEASTFFEYGTTFFATSSSILAIAEHLIYSWLIQKRSKFIENCEKFVGKREC